MDELRKPNVRLVGRAGRKSSAEEKLTEISSRAHAEDQYRTASERRAEGKALRENVPRETHAGWKPPKDRRDPVDLLRAYTRLCAWALARAHARSGDAAMISGYMGSSEAFDEAIGEFAVEYADQNQRDYRAFVRAVREERVKALVES
ncbi:MAG TPA: DUF2252 family protein [Candidatus Binataceae bacterium]|nr:DUF2252 family protein [Candidatus Binataceae bacterium]